MKVSKKQVLRFLSINYFLGILLFIISCKEKIESISASDSEVVFFHKNSLESLEKSLHKEQIELLDFAKKIDPNWGDTQKLADLIKNLLEECKKLEKLAIVAQKIVNDRSIISIEQLNLINEGLIKSNKDDKSKKKPIMKISSFSASTLSEEKEVDKLIKKLTEELKTINENYVEIEKFLTDELNKIHLNLFQEKLQEELKRFENEFNTTLKTQGFSGENPSDLLNEILIMAQKNRSILEKETSSSNEKYLQYKKQEETKAHALHKQHRDGKFIPIKIGAQISEIYKKIGLFEEEAKALEFIQKSNEELINQISQVKQKCLENYTIKTQYERLLENKKKVLEESFNLYSNLEEICNKTEAFKLEALNNLIFNIEIIKIELKELLDNAKN